MQNDFKYIHDSISVPQRIRSLMLWNIYG